MYVKPNDRFAKVAAEKRQAIWQARVAQVSRANAEAIKGMARMVAEHEASK